MNTENGNGMVMPVAPMGYGYGGFPMMGNWGNGFGDGFGGGWWVILFLFAMMGNGFGGWGMNGFGGWGLENAMLYPYLFNTQTQNDVNRGFADAGLSNQLNGIQASISNGFASSEVANCNRAMDAMQTAYNNQIANMNQQFATATELDNRLDNLSMSLQKCCCDNELAISQTQNVIQAEAAANRYADANNTRDIIQNQTAGTQAVLDKLCQLELDGVRSQLDAERRENVGLQNQLNMATMQASQNAQTAALVQDNNAQTAQLIQRIAPYPIPAFQVGNPYGFNYNYGYGNCGCGCNGGFAGVA